MDPVPTMRFAAGWAVAFVAIMFVITQIANPLMLGLRAAALAFSVIALLCRWSCSPGTPARSTWLR